MNKTYNITCHKGYLGEFGTEWWKEKDWEEHNNYVKECIADGTYEEEFEVNLTLQHFPFWDDQQIGKAVESYKMIILDFSNDNTY